MPLYEVAIIEKPTKKETEEEGKTERLVFGPSPVVARDPQSALLAVVMEKDEYFKIDPNRTEVLIRPFA
jgi:hypothetical protein